MQSSSWWTPSPSPRIPGSVLSAHAEPAAGGLQPEQRAGGRQLGSRSPAAAIRLSLRVTVTLVGWSLTRSLSAAMTVAHRARPAGGCPGRGGGGHGASGWHSAQQSESPPRLGTWTCSACARAAVPGPRAGRPGAPAARRPGTVTETRTSSWRLAHSTGQAVVPPPFKFPVPTAADAMPAAADGGALAKRQPDTGSPATGSGRGDGGLQPGYLTHNAPVPA
jgi:hypothetical protein